MRCIEPFVRYCLGSLDRVKRRNDEVMSRPELSRRTFLVANEWSEGRTRLSSEYTKNMPCGMGMVKILYLQI